MSIEDQFEMEHLRCLCQSEFLARKSRKHGALVRDPLQRARDWLDEDRSTELQTRVYNLFDSPACHKRPGSIVDCDVARFAPQLFQAIDHGMLPGIAS